jgi:hypothetical protein
VQIQQSEETVEPQAGLFFEKYKIHLSVAAAVLIVGVSALAHYKNEQVKEELVKSIAQYQKNLLFVGGDLAYASIDCSGIFFTDCEIKGINLSLLGEKQLSIASLRFGDVEELGAFKELAEGKSINASIDIEADAVSLPKTIIAQLVAQNVSNAFQQSTIEKLNSMNFEFKGEFEGDRTMMKHVIIDRFVIDNAIMPIRFAMEARNVSAIAPDSMILDHFSLSARNKALSDVTYESVKSFVDALSPSEKVPFLKEFGLTAAEMQDKKKAASEIDMAMAKRFESDLVNTRGVVEKELIRAIIKILKGEEIEIVLKGENKKDMSVAQVQNLLLQSSSMRDDAAQKFMEDKFTITVEAD